MLALAVICLLIGFAHIHLAVLGHIVADSLFSQCHCIHGITYLHAARGETGCAEKQR